MDFQGLGHDSVKKSRFDHGHRAVSANPSPQTIASQVTILHAPLMSPTAHRDSSSPEPPTAIAYIPSPPSTPQLYGLDRLHPQQSKPTHHAAQSPVNPRPLVRFDPKQVTMTAPPPPADWVISDFKDDLVREVGTSVTPGVDSTPYIQYALEAMTQPRDDDGDDDQALSMGRSRISDEVNPMHRYLPAAVPGLFQPQPAYIPVPTQDGLNSPAEELAALRQQRQRAKLDEIVPSGPQTKPRASWTRPQSGGTARLPCPVTPSPSPGFEQGSPGEFLLTLDRLDGTEETPPIGISPRDINNWQSQTDKFKDPEKAIRYPPLIHRPWVLSTPSLLLLAALCVSMIAALMFSATYSESRNGLMAYSGTIYDGDYFLFRVFPQFLAALVLLYSQSVIVAAFRILPFSALASDDVRSRRNVGFLPLYPKSFLWPQLVSSWQVWIPIVVTWIMNITIPLQSCLFTVVYVNEVWIWSTVQGVAWILVALYVSMLLATILLIVYWHNRRTGLGPNRDMRSLADIIALLAPSNSSEQYAGTETAEQRNDMRHMLYNNAERLGYWRSPDVPGLGLWYGIGIPMNEEKVSFDSFDDRVHEKGPRGAPRDVMQTHGDVRTRYLPWCIRDAQIGFWVVFTLILLIALFVVCFNPATDVRNGFLPLLSAAPGAGGFSAADFLYAFLPSLLGMILFLWFQSLDLTLRILTPWGELSNQAGSLAGDSILLDYAACLPLESTWKAVRHGHWRIAFISLLSTTLLLIPVLAGGLFIALTPQDRIVHMYPNTAVLAILLTLLVLMFVGLIALIPNRKQFRLPHAVTCLNEIISFCYAEDLRKDPAFEGAQHHRLLEQKLGAYMGNTQQSRWVFGTAYGQQGKLGIHRFGKYTGEIPHVLAATQRVKANQDRSGNASRKDAERQFEHARRQYAISRPVPQGNSTMIQA